MLSCIIPPASIGGKIIRRQSISKKRISHSYKRHEAKSIEAVMEDDPMLSIPADESTTSYEAQLA